MGKLDKAILCNIFIAAGALLLFAGTKNIAFLAYALISFCVYFVRLLYTISVSMVGRNIKSVVLCIALISAVLFITFPFMRPW